MRMSALQEALGAIGTVFRDRQEAGEKLAAALANWKNDRPVVLGLARGGVVLAAEVARHLQAPLDALVCLKVGAPDHPEFAIGAVAPGGIRIADRLVLARLGIRDEEFDWMAKRREEEVERRLDAYRRGMPPPQIEGKTAIIVDDGLATGTTALAAVRYARSLNAAKVILAVPVCSSSATELLENEVDDLVCLSQPSLFYSVGQWYQDFGQVSDQEVVELLGHSKTDLVKQSLEIPVGEGVIRGDLTFAGPGAGVVIFAHGSGSGRLSPRNQFVASELNRAGHGTLLIDLLTEEEELIDMQTRHLRFDIPFLIDRLAEVTNNFLRDHNLPVGYFGASTGAAAAIGASTRFPGVIKAVVSRGGRPDLADDLLPLATAPTLLIVGQRDESVIEMNREAMEKLGSPTKELRIVSGATHLFEEPGTLEEVSRLAADWFGRYLR